jgi:excisionase family DNA binding protein
MEDRWLSVGEIAAYMGVKPDTVYKWKRLKGMPHRKNRAAREVPEGRDREMGEVRKGCEVAGGRLCSAEFRQKYPQLLCHVH